jgi:hypothetical protein
MAGPFARAVAAVLAAALINVSLHGAARASAGDDRAAASQMPLVRAAAPGESSTIEAGLTLEAIRASARRWATAESFRAARSSQSSTATSSDRCRASLTEKLAWIYALVGGSILLVYGPQEKEGGVWTRDGKSETIAGAASVALSFALLRDIRKKGRP